MSDPQTPNLGVYQPGVGTDVGTWYLPLNANFGVQDSLSSNVAALNPPSGGTLPLTTAPNSGASWSGPYTSQSAVLKCTGALTGDSEILIPRPGFWIVDNQCTGNFVVLLVSTGGGQVICAPPGQVVHVYCDGTNVKYVNFPPVGSYMDLAVQVVPSWINRCTVTPYLLCDGTVYTASTLYGVGNPTPLLTLLGNAFGGNGITTFGVPDLRNRVRIPVGGGTNRVTVGGSGINGGALASVGGDQLPQQHTHTFQGTTQTWNINQTQIWQDAGGGTTFASGSGPINHVTPTVTITPAGINLNYGSGASGNMQPTLVAGMSFIKT